MRKPIMLLAAGTAAAALSILAAGTAAAALSIPAAGTAAAALSIPAAGLASASKGVTVKDFAFSPSSLTVRHGTKVTWTFKDGVKHNVTVKRGPAKFHSRDIARGSFSHKLAKPGTYKLICSIHTDMHQTIVVT